MRVAAENYNVNPAIEGAALGCVIAGDGMKLGIPGGGQSFRREFVFSDQEARHLRSAGGR